jgi:hypothetical protein
VLGNFTDLDLGSAEHEEQHLRPSMDAPDGLMIAVPQGERITGGSGGLPVAAGASNPVEPFRAAMRSSGSSGMTSRSCCLDAASRDSGGDSSRSPTRLTRIDSASRTLKDV